MKLKINSKIVTLGLSILFLAVALFIVLNNPQQETQVETKPDLTEVFNSGQYDKAQNQAEAVFYDESLSNEVRGEAFYTSLNAVKASEGREAAYTYLKNNQILLDEVDLIFDFYVIAGALAEENSDTELMNKMYEEALKVDVGLDSELIYLQEMMEEKLENTQ